VVVAVGCGVAVERVVAVDSAVGRVTAGVSTTTMGVAGWVSMVAT